MKNNQYFNGIRASVKANEAKSGEREAFWAWLTGCQKGLDCPWLQDTVWEEVGKDFLAVIEKAGFTKFAYSSHSTMTFENIISFMKAGWEITGRLEIDDSDFDAPERKIDCVVFERRS